MSTAISDTARIHNIVAAKLQHSPFAMTLGDFQKMADLHGVAQHRIRDCLRTLVKNGQARKIPVSTPNAKERVGFEWRKPGDIDYQILTKEKLQMKKSNANEDSDIRVRVNDDHSLTIITSKVRITIEVPK